MNITTEQLESKLPRMATYKHISMVIIIAVCFTLVFNPEALVIWTQKLPVNWVTDILYQKAIAWRDLMDEFGLTIVFEKLREAFRWFQSL